MSRAHTCPRCEGEKKVPDPRLGDFKPCPTCDATGVVWDRDGGPEEAAAVGSDAHEINGL